MASRPGPDKCVVVADGHGDTAARQARRQRAGHLEDRQAVDAVAVEHVHPVEVAVNTDPKATKIEPKTTPAEAPGAPVIGAVPAPGTAVDAAIKSTAAVASAIAPKVGEVRPVDPGRKQVTKEDLDKMTASGVVTTPRSAPTPRKLEPIVKDPPRIAKPLPPVPPTFDAALRAGKDALARGRALIESDPDAAKNAALDCWDEAEAMLRGAWNLKPGDTDVTVLFEDLAKQVGVIALVKSPMLISKPNGLVVLNAEPSIVFPKEKDGRPAPMYYAWEQVEGKDLSIRREDLVNKMIGLRIKYPGTYKFELVVSDGTRGGNPVTVTVEVR